MGLSQRGQNEIVVSIVMFVVVSIVVSLRFVARSIVRRKMELSDIFTAISWVLLLAFEIQLVLWATVGNNGRQTSQTSLSQQSEFFKIFYINQITYFVLVPCIKMSIVFFYRSVFFAVRSFRLFANALVVTFIAWGLAITLVAVFQCSPIQSAWLATNGKCIDQKGFIYAFQYLSIVFDFTLLLMPLPVIWRIQRSKKDRIALIAIFTMGGLGCVSGIPRALALKEMQDANMEYTIYRATIWTLVEPSVGMLCGSLPFLRCLFFTKSHTTNTELSDKRSSSTESYSGDSWQPLSSRKSNSDGLVITMSRDFTITVIENHDISHDESCVNSNRNIDHLSSTGGRYKVSAVAEIATP